MEFAPFDVAAMSNAAMTRAGQKASEQPSLNDVARDFRDGIESTYLIPNIGFTTPSSTPASTQDSSAKSRLVNRPGNTMYSIVVPPMTIKGKKVYFPDSLKKSFSDRFAARTRTRPRTLDSKDTALAAINAIYSGLIREKGIEIETANSFLTSRKLGSVRRRLGKSRTYRLENAPFSMTFAIGKLRATTDTANYFEEGEEAEDDFDVDAWLNEGSVVSGTLPTAQSLD